MTEVRTVDIEIENQLFRLLPEKAMFWVNESGLIISDVHLGKAGHFRKNGIAIPESTNDRNLELLNELIGVLKPKWILFLGDLFHSEKNEEWDSFRAWRATHSDLKCFLVMGNHELYPMEDYEALGIECMNAFVTNQFIFVHDEKEVNANESRFIFSGHIHPAVRLKGKGRQSVQIPCFYFEDRKVILPAFGKLTGTFAIKPKKNSRVYGVLDNQILQIQ